jgi:hypothetical protein
MSGGGPQRAWAMLTLVAATAPVIAAVVIAMQAGGHDSDQQAMLTVNSGAAAAAPPSEGQTCDARPSECGFPDATNTGVPAGIELTPVEGNVFVREAGTVIEGQDIHGCIVIEAPDVAIRNTRVTGPCAFSIRSIRGEYAGGGALIEDVEVDCQHTPSTAFGSDDMTVRRVYVHGCVNGFNINNNVTVEDSFVDDPYEADDAHADGIQLAGGSDIVIRGNTIFTSVGTSAIIAHPTDNANVIIEDNLLGGGSYALYCPTNHSVEFRVIDNQFSRRFNDMGGVYGPWTSCETATEVRGNVWADTQDSVTLP